MCQGVLGTTIIPQFEPTQSTRKFTFLLPFKFALEPSLDSDNGQFYLNHKFLFRLFAIQWSTEMMTFVCFFLNHCVTLPKSTILIITQVSPKMRETLCFGLLTDISYATFSMHVSCWKACSGYSIMAPSVSCVVASGRGGPVFPLLFISSIFPSFDQDVTEHASLSLLIHLRTLFLTSCAQSVPCFWERVCCLFYSTFVLAFRPVFFHHNLPILFHHYSCSQFCTKQQLFSSEREKNMHLEIPYRQEQSFLFIFGFYFLPSPPLSENSWTC